MLGSRHAPLLRLRLQHGSRCDGGPLPGLEASRDGASHAPPFRHHAGRIRLRGRDLRRVTWGVLWDLAFGDVPTLDRYESVASGLYVKVSQVVLTDGGPKRALVYMARGAGAGTPRPGYLEGVIAAASEAGLPPNYVREIEMLLPKAAGARSAAEPLPSAAIQPRWSAPAQGRLAKPWVDEP